MRDMDSRWGAVHRVRLGHVQKLLRDRYGTTVPDDDAGAEDLRVLLHVKALCYSPARREQALLNAIEIWAPWMGADTARAVAAEITAKPMKLKADTLGRMLNLDSATRERLRLWQIRPAEIDAVEFKKWQRERRRQRQREIGRRRRRNRGSLPRAQWLAEHSTASAKPWIAAGVSRATWYRDRALRQTCPQTNETGSTALTNETGASPLPMRQVRKQSISKHGATHLSHAGVCCTKDGLAKDRGHG
jgi:hypothetical protein